MKKIFKLYVVGVLFSLLTGCMTYSGNKHSVLNSIEPTRSPYIGESVGDFTTSVSKVADKTFNDSKWWKGNVHTHSLWSDGDSPPEKVSAWYF